MAIFRKRSDHWQDPAQPSVGMARAVDQLQEAAARLGPAELPAPASESVVVREAGILADHEPSDFGLATDPLRFSAEKLRRQGRKSIRLVGVLLAGTMRLGHHLQIPSATSGMMLDCVIRTMTWLTKDGRLREAHPDSDPGTQVELIVFLDCTTVIPQGMDFSTMAEDALVVHG